MYSIQTNCSVSGVNKGGQAGASWQQSEVGVRSGSCNQVCGAGVLSCQTGRERNQGQDLHWAGLQCSVGRCFTLCSAVVQLVSTYTQWVEKGRETSSLRRSRLQKREEWERKYLEQRDHCTATHPAALITGGQQYRTVQLCYQCRWRVLRAPAARCTGCSTAVLQYCSVTAAAGAWLPPSCPSHSAVSPPTAPPFPAQHSLPTRHSLKMNTKGGPSPVKTK